MSLYKNWEEVRTRKNSNKICRDMFISNSRGTLTFCEVKNSVLVKKETINKSNAEEIIVKEKLQFIKDRTFSNCGAYRTESSNVFIAELYKTVGIY